MTKEPAKRRLRRGATRSYLVEKVTVIDERLWVVRTAASGEYWSLSFYIKAEKRNYREALRTKSLAEAKQRAISRYIELSKIIDSGGSLFAKTARDLVAQFLASEKPRIAEDGRHSADGITKQRFAVITTVAQKHFLAFVGADTKLDRIPEEKFEEYYAFRRKAHSTIKKVTLRNERSLLGKLLRFGVRKGFLPRGYSPQFPKLAVNTQKYHSKEERRDAFEPAEWTVLALFLRDWPSEGANDDERYERQVVKDFIFIGAGTGLRPGELRKLKWLNIKKIHSDDSVDIIVPRDTKTGARPVVGRGGDALARIRSYSEYTEATDWVFADRTTGKQFSRRYLYELWRDLMKESGLNRKGKNLGFYSLRHTYCTEQLASGQNPFLLAQNMGTSLKYIEENYSHLEISRKRSELVKEIGLGAPKTKQDQIANMAIFTSDLNRLKIDASALEATPVTIAKPFFRKAAARKKTD